MNEKKSPIAGFLSYFYGNFVVLLLGFVQTPIATRLMSAEEYGRTGMFETAVSCIYIFAILGMDQTYIRYYYKEDIDRDALMRQCLFPSLGIVSFLVVLYFFFSRQVNLYLFDRTGFDVTALVIAYTVISVFERFLFLDVRMQQNGRLYSNINIAQKVLNIFFLLGAFFFLGNDFRVVLAAMTFSWGATTLFLGARYLIRKGMAARAAAAGGTGGEVSGEAGGQRKRRYPQMELARYGIPFIFVLLMEWLQSSCDRIALKTWSSYGELGIYTAAMKIMVLLLTFKNTFLAFWSPVAMERYEKADGEETRAFFRRAFDLVRFLCFFAAAGLTLCRRLIVLLFGSSYRGADRIIPFLTLMPIFAILFEITVQGIKFRKRNLFLNLASLAAIVCNIAGNAWFVPRYAGVGAAMATGIAYLVYFTTASFLSERVYPVGYDYVRTAVGAVLLFLYAALAAWSSNIMLTYMVGIGLLCFFLIMEHESVSATLQYASKLIRRKG